MFFADFETRLRPEQKILLFTTDIDFQSKTYCANNIIVYQLIGEIVHFWKSGKFLPFVQYVSILYYANTERFAEN